ncbi:MAG: M24 family metallopeptidase [Acidimicrobiia bacterium]
MAVLDLPGMDVAGRIPRLRAGLDGAGCDALVVTHLTNVRYLTGFTGSAALLVVAAHEAVLVTDGRYEEQAATQLAASGAPARLAVGRTAAAQGEEVQAALDGSRRPGLEADHVTWADQRRWAERLGDRELVPAQGPVEALRAVKDEGEVARVEAACAIADEALAAVRAELVDGPTERELARRLEAEMRRRGADDLSFPTIVASGPNGSRPHHEPTDRPIGPGELVTIDFGALVDGYHSDMTRTLAVGGRAALGADLLRVLEVVTEAQAAGVAAVRAGVDASEVDRACREVIAAAGWADAFVHGTGHGVGLDIHEAPRVSANPGDTLAAGHLVTVEPGVYLPGVGGVRVEDTVVVTPGGCRPLTRAPKD